MQKVQNKIKLSEEIYEPAWPYDMDDSYMELDLGDEAEGLKADGVSLVVFKRPWFKQNYRHSPKNNFKLYRRPYFHMSEE